jgi:phage terminase small subunit
VSDKPAKKRKDASAGYRKRHFALEYIIDKNATAAARRIGCSERSAHDTGCRLLKDPDVQALIEAGLQRVQAKAEIDLSTVVIELRRILLADVGEAVDVHGEFLPLDKWPLDLRRALSGFDNEELFERDEYGNQISIGRVKKARFWSKTDAANQLMKHLGGFAPLKVEVDTGLASKMSRARERVAAGVAAAMSEVDE